MKRRLILGAALLVAQLLGCAAGNTGSKEGATVPAERPAIVSDEPKWIRIESDHFDLATDLSETEALRAAEVLETTRAAMLSAAWPGNTDDLRARTTVVVFQDGLDFMHFFNGNTLAVTVWSVRPTIVLWGKSDYWQQRTGVTFDASSSRLRHELTHRLARARYARQPMWFSEGLAQYLETLTVSADGTKATLGEVSPTVLRMYSSFRVRVSDALAWSSYAEHDDDTILGLYGISWLLVHFLYDTRAHDFEAFQHALARGVAPDLAWRKSFGAFRLEDLDAQLVQYAKLASFKRVVVPIERPSVRPVRKLPITEADVHAIRAHLALAGAELAAGGDLRDEAQQELGRALALEPANPLAVRLLLSSDKSPPRSELSARLRAQVAKRPDDGDAWLLLAEIGAPSEREAAARKAVALMSANSDACVVLASHLVATGRAEEALPLAKKAASLAPWDHRALDTYAAALFAGGRCADAILEETRAIDALPDGRARSPLARESRRKLDEYKRSCARSTRPQR